MARTIQSPGVEVKETDLSLRPNLPVGTTVFVPGFANQGPTDELLTVTSLTEFEQIYGLPQNAAERYMYHSVKAIFQSPANLLVTRLPYGGDEGETFADNSSVQVYPTMPRPQMIDLGDPSLQSVAVDGRAMFSWDDLENIDSAADYLISAGETTTRENHTLREAITQLIGGGDPFRDENDDLDPNNQSSGEVRSLAEIHEAVGIAGTESPAAGYDFFNDLAYCVALLR